MRVEFLMAYLGYVTDPRTPRARDVIVLPAGFHQQADPNAVRQAMGAKLAGYLKRAILIGAGIDTPAGREYGYLLDLSGDSVRWPVFVEKFNREEPRGNPEDRRSCMWGRASSFCPLLFRLYVRPVE
jgi:hypothetical protein